MSQICTLIAEQLASHGVTTAIVSSGSRSLRMVNALAQRDDIDVRMVIDERVAAFTALGMAYAMQRPVALVCTSGTAMLNYSPAIAEAFYRHIPLVVITTDRPVALVEINDGQTINQLGPLDNFIKQRIDVDGCDKATDDGRMGYSEIDVLLNAMLSQPCGPVQINLRLEEWGNDTPDRSWLSPRSVVKETQLGTTLIFIGATAKGVINTSLLEQVATLDNVVVVADQIANCNNVTGVIHNVEAIAQRIAEKGGDYEPDTLITIGTTSPLSRRFKEWLRAIPQLRHIAVAEGANDCQRNTYGCLIESPLSCNTVDDVLSYVYNENQGKSSTFGPLWRTLSQSAASRCHEIAKSMPWCDLKALSIIVEHLPDDVDLHVSNGMSIRYMSLLPLRCSLSANRGVNGIDGSTSTAIGASIAHPDRPTLLITGDMSALYDISALFSRQAAANFKMVILNNGGGEIFRTVKATCQHPLREPYLSHIPNTDWKKIATAADYCYFRAASTKELSEAIDAFMQKNDKPAMLEIVTMPGNSQIYTSTINEIIDAL